MSPDDFEKKLKRVADLYRSSLDLRLREVRGERFDPPDTRLRQLAIAGRWLEEALEAVNAERS